MGPRDTNDSTCVIYGPSENEAGEIILYLAVCSHYPLTGVPGLWPLSSGRKVTPSGYIRGRLYASDPPQRELISNVVPEVDLAKHRRQSPSPLWFTSCYEHGSCETIPKHMCKHCKKSGTRKWDKKERECGKTLFVSPDFKLGYCVCPKTTARTCLIP